MLRPLRIACFWGAGLSHFCVLTGCPNGCSKITIELLVNSAESEPEPRRLRIDQMGNRTSVLDTGVTTNYTQASGGLNQYSQVGTNAVGNGNEHEIASYQGNAYNYVNDERLASITSGGNTYYLLYDAFGRCVKRTLK